jgi:anti-sigma regulatory factor (Ser/Thr protein kinase)
MEENRIYDLLLCLGEAATNAIKHGHGGVVSIHRGCDAILIKVRDQGPGIENLVLPEATLRLGYSTANSMGMGYKAIISMSDKVYLATGAGGTIVAFEMKLQPEEMCLDIAALPDTW